MKTKELLPAVPAALDDVALIGAGTCAAIGEVSISWWHDEVRAGRAPKPVIQQPRFTRWRQADVRRFWADRAAQCAADHATAGDRMSARAKRASQAARAKAQATRTSREGEMA
ncbi:MAG: hypothetical protein RJA10_1044 [Pseudomonadota bacterium]|jgi:predicted DNA-binding transcriptional regulator AlpA